MPDRPRFRIKLVMPNSQDAHYFYADTLPEAEAAAQALEGEIPAEIPRSLYVYVETSLGHVRIK